MGPGSAERHFVPHRVRDTELLLAALETLVPWMLRSEKAVRC